MGYLAIGLCAVVIGFLGTAFEAEEGTPLPWLLVAVGGVVLVLVGMVTHVVRVNRGDRRGPS